ncbi:unnamed protein product [Phytophthora fragariaefolia]|uniref:Unnamed protein product n=1 Tax=Phytophthora fragariaefolia TaxID=1490495 RepID=A0A9W6XTA2_9STRA|nr:unnamed protein product [Phytophthora fragariaefolia]
MDPSRTSVLRAEDEDRYYPGATTLRSRSTPSGGGLREQVTVSAALMQERDGVPGSSQYPESLLHAAGDSDDQGAAEVLNVRLFDAVERLPWMGRLMGSTAVAVDIGDREVADKLAAAALERGDGEVVTSEEENKLDLIALNRLGELLIPKSAYSIVTAGTVGSLSTDEAKTCAKSADDYEVDESDLLSYFPKPAWSDEDRDLVAGLVRAIMTYRPQANGTAEIMLQTLTRSLKMYVSDVTQKDWGEYAERLTYSLNTAQDRVRGDTPFYLTHGWDPRSTLEASIPLGSTRRRDRDARRWRYRIQQQYQRAREQVKERLREAIRDRADHHHEQVLPHKIEVGAQVWLYLDRAKEGYAQKLAHMWHGPFQGLELVGDHAARLETAGTSIVFSKTHKTIPRSAGNETCGGRGGLLRPRRSLPAGGQLGDATGRRRVRGRSNRGHEGRSTDSIQSSSSRILGVQE